MLDGVFFIQGGCIVIQTIIKWVKFIAIVLLCCINQAWAQPTAAQQHMQQQQQNQNMGGMLQSDSVRKCGNPNGCGNSSSSMAEVRAWHERERKIQAEIAELRRTPYWMAIAYDFASDKFSWGADIPLSKEQWKRPPEVVNAVLTAKWYWYSAMLVQCLLCLTVESDQ